MGKEMDLIYLRKNKSGKSDDKEWKSEVKNESKVRMNAETKVLNL